MASRPGFRPVHPGMIIKRNIEALGVTIEEFADRIDVSRQNVHAILKGTRSVSPDMAARLGRVFNNSPQFWLNMQNNHDVWEPEREPEIQRIKPFKTTLRKMKGVAREAVSGRIRSGAQPVAAHKRGGATMRRKGRDTRA